MHHVVVSCDLLESEMQVLAGGVEHITYKSDMYSLGVVLGEIITGEPPQGRSVDIE